jgi:hypothetical protein
MQGPRHLPPHSRRLSLIAVVMSGTFFAVVLGCRTTHVVSVDPDGAPVFQQLTIVYDLIEPTTEPARDTPVDLAYAKAHPLRAALVSHQSTEPSRAAPAHMRLRMQCPVPNGRADEGLITLCAPARSGEEWVTVAERTISRADVHLLLAHLANGGVCDSETRPTGCARISIEIDGHRVEKPWTREPRLDRLAVETYDARAK